MDKIKSFKGKYKFLSNSYAAIIIYDDVWYPSVEHAFQAAKEDDPGYKTFIATLPSAQDARRYGKSAVLREDWDSVKDSIMLELLRIKFKQRSLSKLLKATGDAELENGYSDRYWGTSKGVGKNQLGKLLMQVRDELSD